ncbi:MAG: hypothetical protein ABIV51_06225 [Saprospiraceae bacterium]
MSYYRHIDFHKIAEEEFIDFMVFKHHAFSRQLSDLIVRNISSARQSNPSLLPILDKLLILSAALQSELELLIRQEEDCLIPFISTMLELKSQVGQIHFLKQSISNSSVQKIQREQISISNLLNAIRKVTSSFEPPETADELFKLCYAELRELEANLLQYFQTENTFLFPKLQSLEAEIVSRSDYSGEDSNTSNE